MTCHGFASFANWNYDYDEYAIVTDNVMDLL